VQLAGLFASNSAEPALPGRCCCPCGGDPATRS